MKINDTPFFKTTLPILPTLPFLGEEKSELLLFMKISKTQHPLYKGGSNFASAFSSSESTIH